MVRRLIIHLMAVGLMAAAALSGDAHAAEKIKWSNQAVILGEYDDNVYKIVDQVEGDFLARAFFDTRLTLPAGDSNTLLLAYTLGAKKFVELVDQDTLINQLLLRFVNREKENTYFGGDGRFKLRKIRDGDEDYNKTILNAFAGHYFAPGVSGRINMGYTRFDFRAYDYYDYWTQAFGLAVKKAYSHALGLGLHYTYEDIHYPIFAYENAATAGGDVFLKRRDELRHDVLQEVGFFFSSNRYLLSDLRYTLQVNNSNSYGDTYYNHRVRLTLSKALTDNTNLHFYALTNFRDSYQEVLIPRSFSIEEDDENTNRVMIKINRSLSDNLWLEGRYGRMWSQYSVRRFKFQKNTYSLGLSSSF